MSISNFIAAFNIALTPCCCYWS